MNFKEFRYEPEDGIKNEIVFPDTPIDSKSAREQFQRLYDQVRDALNLLQRTLCDPDGAKYVGADTPGLEGDTVALKLKKLKEICDGLATGVTPPDYITDDLLFGDIKIGSLKTLLTRDKSCVVKALNELLTCTKYRPYIITESCDFIVPQTGLYKVTVVGGGAGGCVAGNDVDTLDPTAPGGASGGTAIKWIELLADQVIEVTVGKGGKGAVHGEGSCGDGWRVGEAGESSSFGSYCSASGGGAMNNHFTNTGYAFGGIPGMGYDGDINILGKRAPHNVTKRMDSSASPSHGFGGGDSYLGVGGYGHFSRFVTPTEQKNLNGIDGSGYGSGGGGSIAYDSNLGNTIAELKGGDGANGVVIVEYFGYGA